MNRTRTFASRAAGALALAALVACGPKATSVVTPTLPGDGDAHVAKPVDKPADKPADPWTGRTDLIEPPAPQPPAALKLPPIERFTLKNGLQVFVVKSDRLPEVSMQLVIKAGRIDEPKARLGVAEFAADMLPKGTKKRNALAIAKAIDFVGGSLSADASFEATLVNCTVMAKDLGTCMSLVPEMVTQPAFAAGEMPKVREGLLAEVRNRLDDAGQLAGAHFQNLLWGDDHVRGWILGEGSVNAITRDDLVAWHKTWFAPNNAMLAVSGDVDVTKLKKDLERAFGGWKKATLPPHPTYVQPKLDKVKIRLVDKPKQTQTHIRIGHFGIAHTDPRYFESLVWNYVLGGGAFSSRLMKVVRSEGGKTYGASSTFDRNLDAGSFVAATFTRSAETVATVELVLGELSKMQQKGPTAEEVADAISNIAGSYALRYQSAADVASALLAAELHGFGEQYLTNYAIRVGQVDVQSAREAASEILDPANFVIVLVGDASVIEPQLKKEGWRYEKVKFTDPIGEPVRELPKADPAQEKAARALLADALVAKGKKIASMKSLRMDADGTLSTQGQQVPVTISRVFQAPDKMRVDLTLMGSIQISYAIDGKTGWQAQNGQVEDIAADQLTTLEEQRWHDPEFVLLRPAEKGTKVLPLPDEDVDGKACSVINLTSADGANTATLFLDKKTKLLVQIAYPENGRVTIDSFDDYKDVGGIQIAHTRVSKSSGDSAELKVTKVEVDAAVDATLFARPKAAKDK
ncbi:MAG: insulinase family protein [Myxococcales bacterium]|nr:insulinase family protein [Myxococcales bacterium]